MATKATTTPKKEVIKKEPKKRTTTSKMKSQVKKKTKIVKNDEFIYIYCIKRDDVIMYVGSTNDAERRLQEHSSELAKGTHSNKTLSKAYLEDNNFTYEILYKIPNESTLTRWFLEMVAISYHTPKCNKCVLQQGRMRMVMSKMPKDLAEQVIKVILEYYKVK